MNEELKDIFKFIDTLPQRKNLKKGKINGYYSKADYFKKNWNQVLYLTYVKERSNYKKDKIVAVFIEEKQYQFDNYEQLSPQFDRFSKVAKRLEGYDLDRVRKTCQYLKENADYKWTLETVEKYILENIDELNGEKPIITLSNGEKIYDTKRIIDLEKQRRIKWNGIKWIENKEAN